MSKQILTLVEEKEVNPENVHVYLEICVYMNIYACNNNLLKKKERDHDLKDRRKGCMVGFEVRKGKGEM